MKLTVILFFISIFAANAQANFISATITKKDGTILRGQINYNDWPKTPTAIEFKLNELVSVFYPKDLQSFAVLNEKYISRIVKLDVTEQRLSKMNFDDQTKFLEVDVFLNVLNEGKANLYLFSDYRDHFFYQKDGEILELINREYLTKRNTELKKYKKYLGQLILIFGDCPSININKNLVYQSTHLSKVFDRYNVCDIENEAAYKNVSNMAKNSLYITVGVNNTTMHIASDESIYQNFDGKGFVSPVFGVAYEANLSKKEVNRWSLYNELTYSHYQNEYVYSYNRGSFSEDFKNEQTINLNISTFNVGSLVRYKFSKQNINFMPFLNGGIGVVVPVSKDVELIQRRLPDSGNSQFNIPVRSIYYSASLGGGFIYKKLSLELRYTIQSNYSETETLAHFKNLGLILSYKIL